MTKRFDDVVKPSQEKLEFEKRRDREFRAREKLEDTARNKIAAFVKEYLDTAGFDYSDPWLRDRSWIADHHTHPLSPIFCDSNWKNGWQDDAGIYFRGLVSFGSEIDQEITGKEVTFTPVGWNVQYRRAFPPQPPEAERHWSTSKGMTEKRLREVLKRLKTHYFPNVEPGMPEYFFHRITKEGKDITLLDYVEVDEDAYRLIVINHTVPTTKNFVPTNNGWKKIAEPLGPLDEVIYHIFKDRNR